MLKGLVSIVSWKLVLLLVPSLFLVLLVLLVVAVPPASSSAVPSFPAQAAPLSCWKLLLLPLALVGLRRGTVSFAFFFSLCFSFPLFAVASLLKLSLEAWDPLLAFPFCVFLFKLVSASSARAVGKLVRLPLAFAGWRLGCVSSPFSFCSWCLSFASSDKLVKLVLFLLLLLKAVFSGGPLCYVLQALLAFPFLRSRPCVSWSLVLQTC